MDSMTSSCCAPSDKFGLELEDPQEAEFRNLAKQQLGLTIVDIGYGESWSNLTTPYGTDTDIDIDSKEEFKNNNNHTSDKEHRDLLTVSGFLHELENLSDLTYRLHNISSLVGIKPILDLCIAFYYVQYRSNIHWILLIAEQGEEESEFILPTMAPSDDDYDDGDRDGYSPRAIQLPGQVEDDYDGGSIFIDNKDSTYGGIYYSSISKGDDHEKHWCHIFDLDEDEEMESEDLSIFKDEWIVKFAGCTTAKDIPLPSKIHKQLLHEYHHKGLQYNSSKLKHHHHHTPTTDDHHIKHHWQSPTQPIDDTHHHHQHMHSQHETHNQHWHHHTRTQSHSHWRSVNNTLREYNVIFKLGGSGKSGWSNNCSAIIVDETSLNHDTSDTGLFGFNWRLPSLPVKTGGNGVCFDSEYGLISCGGYKSSSCYLLDFKGNDYLQQTFNWHWQKLPSMNEIRWFPSCIMTNKVLISMCGSSADHEPLSSMEYYSFDNEEWLYLSSCNKPRKYGGLYYNDSTNKLFLGGGDHATQSIEYYDFDKNQWYNLSSTQLPHRYYPNLWQNKFENPNILYISCSYSNSIESLDLRSNEQNWNVICGAKLFKTDSLNLDYNQFRSLL